MTPQEVKDFYGNKIKAAAEIGVSLQTINNWFKENNIPRLSQLAIQTLSKNKLKADSE